MPKVSGSASLPQEAFAMASVSSSGLSTIAPHSAEEETEARWAWEKKPQWVLCGSVGGAGCGQIWG